jgi:hypothetical protein
LFSSSHSSSASTTRTYKDWQLLPSSFDSGRRTSWCHWLRRDWLAMSLRSVIASQMCRESVGTFLASCTAMLVKNLLAWLASLPPLEKKLAPRRPCSEYVRATVRATVDFLVPANPFSQKMLLLSCPSAHSCISRRTSTRVSGRQLGSCCLAYELKGAFSAFGKRLSILPRAELLVNVGLFNSSYINCTNHLFP